MRAVVGCVLVTCASRHHVVLFASRRAKTLPAIDVLLLLCLSCAGMRHVCFGLLGDLPASAGMPWYATQVHVLVSYYRYR